MTNLRIIVADDHPLFRCALRQALGESFAACEFTEAESFDQAVEAVSGARDVDLVLLDLNMPGTEGFSGLLYLRAQYPAVPVVVVSATDDPAVIRRAIEFGASGFIPKSVGAEQIRGAVGRILDGEVWVPDDIDLDGKDDPEEQVIANRLSTLTAQQVRVLMMLARGLLNKQIAYELGVSEATVKAHVSAILQKLDVDSRTQAVIAVSRVSAGDQPWSGSTVSLQ